MVKYVESCCILNFLWVPVPSGTLGSQPWPAASLAPWACCAAHSDPMDPMVPSSRWGRGHMDHIWTPWRLRALCSAAAWWVAKRRRRPRRPRWKSRIADWIGAGKSEGWWCWWKTGPRGNEGLAATAVTFYFRTVLNSELCACVCVRCLWTFQGDGFIII